MGPIRLTPDEEERQVLISFQCRIKITRPTGLSKTGRRHVRQIVPSYRVKRSYVSDG